QTVYFKKKLCYFRKQYLIIIHCLNTIFMLVTKIIILVLCTIIVCFCAARIIECFINIKLYRYSKKNPEDAIYSQGMVYNKKSGKLEADNRSILPFE
ncbi:MAG: hypothetical protein IJW75_06430, partial [Alphaproteobacteria bacterium]|nr:hypothetical protein [Alphaproteobacteria bacterium]